jgi:xylose dehydrogenase (NAD/NADP)
MTAPVKWGILSTADINRKVIPGLHGSEKTELIAVASRDQERADEYAREWEIERAYGSYAALLEDADVEAVYISLPNTLHCDWSIRAVEAGKHVLCEKPMSRYVADVEAAFDAAERSGRILTEAFMYRHNPQTARVRQLVEEVLQLFAVRRGQHPVANRRGRRQPHGRGLLLRQRKPPAGR